MKFHHFFLFLLLAFSSCNSDDSSMSEVEEETNTDSKPNILLIIADDMGRDATDGYPEGNIKPNTPNINSIRDAGITFNNLSVNPSCSPTRAALLTGKYGYRTGVMWAGDEMRTSENVLHNYINQESDNTYATALIGKWHLSGNQSTFNPETLGIDYYAGIFGGATGDYYNWDLAENGATTQQTTYVTTGLTDLATDWLSDQDQPWFLWMAYNAPHLPFHAPPAEMHSQGDLPTFQDGMDELPYFMAAIEALDFQVGRLLNSMSIEERENTTIIFIGDNGTPPTVGQRPYPNRRYKGTLYQGGINVPMFVSGKNVTRTGTDNSLINGTDFYSTIAQIAGSSTTEINDSKSFLPLLSSTTSSRGYQYSERDNGTDVDWTISNGTYKLIVNATGAEEMFDLAADPYEATNLLDAGLNAVQQTAKAELENELGNIRN